MINTHRLVIKVCILSGLLAPFAWGQKGRPIERMETSVHRSEVPRKALAQRETEAIRNMPPPSRRVTLRPLSAAEAAPPARKPGLSPIGVSRALPADALSKGEWSTSPDGKQVWRLAIDSTGAKSLRVHFTDFNAGDGKVWVVGTNETAGPYTQQGLFGKGDFWSDLITGESAIIAYEPAPGAPAGGAPPFRIAGISHVFQETLNGTSSGASTVAATAGEVRPLAAAASCALDVTCYPDYAAPAFAVALMLFESDGSTYACTGTLIANAAQLPFFLTANHCISSEAEAESLITFFKYQTAACNADPPARSSVPHVAGAIYISGQPIALGDFSLLQLSAFPSTDVTMLGWYAGDIGSNQAVAGISHPRGDYKRIAFGQRAADASIRFTTGERMPASAGYQVDWTQGLTESGSSGSPLLAQIDGKNYLVGTLSAGPDVNENDPTQVCSVQNLNASYGRFSVAAPYLSPLLSSSGGLGKPVINAGGVVNAASYDPGIAPATWITIFGQSLAGLTHSAAISDLVGQSLPTSLAGVSVSINGKPAFVQFVSPTQINVEAPSDATQGNVAVTVTNSAGTSNPVSVAMRSAFPAFFTTSGDLVAAVRSDGTVIDATTAARSGDSISLYGNGFGATSPAIAPGLVGSFAAPLTTSLTVTIGNASAPVSFAGLSAAGLDQINVTVPNLPSGDYEVIATVGGQQTKPGVYLRVRNR